MKTVNWEDMKTQALKSAVPSPPGVGYRVGLASESGSLEVLRQEAQDKGAEVTLWCGYVYVMFKN